MSEIKSPTIRKRDVPALLSISMSGVDRLVQQGILTPIKIGKRAIVFNRAEIDNILRA